MLKSQKITARIISDKQELVASGQNDISDICANAMANSGGNLACVARCAISPGESVMGEELHPELLVYVSRCKIMVFLETILGLSAKVPEIKEICRELPSRRNRKVFGDRCYKRNV